MWTSRRVMNVLSTRSLIWTFITHPLVHIHQKTKIALEIADENCKCKRALINHLRNRLNFDLDKNFITAWKSVTNLVIFQSFVAKCCKMRII
jgi:hypothetical protein